MKRFLYILALIYGCVGPLAWAGSAASTPFSTPAITPATTLSTHLKADSGYLACMRAEIPETSRQKVAMLLWPAPVPAPQTGLCAPASKRLEAAEIPGLQQTLDTARSACATELPADIASRQDATFGLLGVLLINPGAPEETQEWDTLMAGSRTCSAPPKS